MDPLASGRHGICSPRLSGLWEPKLISISSRCGAALLPSSSFFLGGGVIPVSKFGSQKKPGLLGLPSFAAIFFMAIFQTSPGRPSFLKVAPEVPMKGFLRWDFSCEAGDEWLEFEHFLGATVRTCTDPVGGFRMFQTCGRCCKVLKGAPNHSYS